MTARKSQPCPNCGKGYDSDGDGFCAFCSGRIAAMGQQNKCPECGQVPSLAITGEYACPTCGTPRMHDEPAREGRCPTCDREKCTWHLGLECSIGQLAPRTPRGTAARRKGYQPVDPKPPKSGTGARRLSPVEAAEHVPYESRPFAADWLPENPNPWRPGTEPPDTERLVLCWVCMPTPKSKTAGFAYRLMWSQGVQATDFWCELPTPPEKK